MIPENERQLVTAQTFAAKYRSKREV